MAKLTGISAQQIEKLLNAAYIEGFKYHEWMPESWIVRNLNAGTWNRKWDIDPKDVLIYFINEEVLFLFKRQSDQKRFLDEAQNLTLS